MEFRRMYPILLFISFAVFGCSESNNTSEDNSEILLDQKFSSARFEMSGLINRTDSFGAAKNSNDVIKGTECQKRGRVLEVRASQYTNPKDGFTILAKSFIFSDPSEAWEDFNGATLVNTSLPSSSRADVIFKITLLDNKNDIVIYESDVCRVSYSQTADRNALVGEIECDNMTERSGGDSLDVKGRFTCDFAAL